MLDQYHETLSQSIDPADFLKKAFQIWEVAGKPVSYGAFARRAGLASRSFPRAVVLREKHLTNRSLPGFIRALGVKEDLKSFFTTLVACEELSRAEAPEKQRALARSKLERVRARLQNRTVLEQDALASLVLSEPASRIYSALGSVSVGATLPEISVRTQLSEGAILAELPQLLATRLIVWDELQQRISPAADRITVLGEKCGSKVQLNYVKSLQKIQKSATERFATDEALYFQSLFSVRSERMAQLKKRLQSVLLEFADESENPDGDRVVNLSVGMILVE